MKQKSLESPFFELEKKVLDKKNYCRMAFEIGRVQNMQRPILIGVGGSSCSGKSTLSAYLSFLLNGDIIQQDYFFKKDDEIPFTDNNLKSFVKQVYFLIITCLF